VIPFKPGDDIKWKTLGGHPFTGKITGEAGAFYEVLRNDGKTVRLRKDFEFFPPADDVGTATRYNEQIPLGGFRP
jgi:hypothetical protein